MAQSQNSQNLKTTNYCSLTVASAYYTFNEIKNYINELFFFCNNLQLMKSFLSKCIDIVWCIRL